jgi:cytoskeletal protein CcmA (bactofilin family)
MVEAQKSKTILGPDCRISGELALDNDALIMGQFKGTLRVSGILELDQSSQVSGTIIAGTLRLAGHADADVIAEDAVELLPGAELTGQVFTARLNVVDGAVFQGDVCVGPKAIEAAQEALAQAPAEEEPSAISQFSISQEDHADEADAAAPPGTTVPSSVNAILARRRTKVLSARNGNGNSK